MFWRSVPIVACCGRYQAVFFAFYGWLVFHCMGTPHFVYLSFDGHLLFSPSSIVNSVAMNKYVYVIVWVPIFTRVDIYLGMELQGYMVIVCWTFRGTAKLVSYIFLMEHLPPTSPECKSLQLSILGQKPSRDRRAEGWVLREVFKDPWQLCLLLSLPTLNSLPLPMHFFLLLLLKVAGEQRWGTEAPWRVPTNIISKD